MTNQQPATMKSVRDQIKEAISGEPYSDWGIRVVERHPAVEPLEESSRLWVNGEPTEHTLPGVSVIEIKGRGKEAIDTAIEHAGIGGSGPNGFYFGKYVLLVRGDYWGDGQDEDEAIFKNAVVHSVFEKEDEGDSPFIELA